MKRTRELTPLGMQIKIALVQQNITSKELAARIGVTGATITEVICGKKQEKGNEKINYEGIRIGGNGGEEK